MNIKRDGHIHSPYCPHGTKDSFEMYVEKALEKGLEEITFTEHMPFTSVFLENKDFQDECAMDIKDIDSYIKDVKEIKKKYERNKKEVPILPELLFCFKLSCFKFIILSFFNV